MQDAEFVRDRLKSLEPRLREHHRTRAIEEDVARWLARRGDLLVERDHLGSRLREVYPLLRQQLLGLLAEIADLDARIAKLMRDRPDAAGSYSLKGVELAARGVDRFTFALPSALEAVQLPELSVCQ